MAESVKRRQFEGRNKTILFDKSFLIVALIWKTSRRLLVKWVDVHFIKEATGILGIQIIPRRC